MAVISRRTVSLFTPSTSPIALVLSRYCVTPHSKCVVAGYAKRSGKAKEQHENSNPRAGESYGSRTIGTTTKKDKDKTRKAKAKASHTNWGNYSGDRENAGSAD